MRGLLRLIIAPMALLLAGGLAPAASAWAPGPAEYGVAQSRNLTFRTPDGRTLRADVYTPTDLATGQPAPGPFPVVLGYTPFGKTGGAASDTPGGNGLNPELVKRGYIAAVVDVPGTGGSEGRFNLFDQAEAQAGKAAVTWAAGLPRSSGKVGMIGLSYAGIDQLFTAAAVGPGSPLKAIFPMAASVDPYRDLFVSGGALNVMSPLGLLFSYGGSRSVTPFLEVGNNLGLAVTLALRNIEQFSRFEGPFAKDMITNGPRRYDVAYWQERAPRRVLEQIVRNDVPTYLVGGLYDVFQRGQPMLYSGLQNAAAGRPVDAPMVPGQPVSGRYQLLTGPWNHGSIGAGIDLTAVQLAWFDRWLKDEDTGVDRTQTPLSVIEPGGRRYEAANYPLTEAKVERLYLKTGRELTSEAPTGGEPTDRIVFTGIGTPCSRSTDQFAAGVLTDALQSRGCLTAARKPVAGAGETTYSTPPLERPLQLGGPIGLTLHTTSTTRESLFAVTVEDVAPDGTSSDVTGGAQLGSQRAIDPERSWPAPDGGWLVPHRPLNQASRQIVPRGGDVTRYDVEVRAAFATIPAGHRLRLRIATSDFPHFIPLADLQYLAGGQYGIRHDVNKPSFLDLSVLED